MTKPLSYTVEEAAKLTGLGRTRLYKELKEGRIKAVKLGRRTLIPHASLESWIDDLEAYPAKPVKDDE